MIERRLACVTVFMWVVITSALTAHAQVSQRNGVFQIGQKVYTVESLIGRTEEQLRDEYNAAVKGLSDEHLQRILSSKMRVGEEPAGKREQREQDLFELCFVGLIEVAALNVMHAHLYDMVAEEQGIDPQIYFDMDVLRDNLSREREHIRYLMELRNKEGDEKEFYAHAKDQFRVTYEFHTWKTARAYHNSSPEFALWPFLYRLEHEHVDELRMKRLMFYEIVSGACDIGGPYFERALKAWLDRRSTYTVIEIAGYKGDIESIEGLLSLVVDPVSGAFAGAGIDVIRKWFTLISPEVAVRTSIGPRGRFADVEAWLPDNIQRVSEDTFRVVLYSRREDPTQEYMERYQLFIKGDAYVIAVSEYARNIRVLSERYEGIVSKLSRSASASLHSFVEVDDYVRRPYPAEHFRIEWSDLHSAMAQAAALVIKRESEKAANYIELLVSKTQTDIALAEKVYYLRVAMRLAETFGLQEHKTITSERMKELRE